MLKSNDCVLSWKGFLNLLQRNSLLRVALLLAWGSSIGCSNLPPRIHPPSVDHDEATELVFSRCDLNSDGAISEEESVNVLAIKRRFSLYDADKDGKVVPEEFKKRLTTMFDPRAALVGADCFVVLGGRPLVGAAVHFEPEDFLAEVIPAADGVTDENGYAEMSTSNEDLPAGAPQSGGLLRPGMYRVSITHPKHKIPAKYNKETTLGEEVSRSTIMTGAFRFALTKD